MLRAILWAITLCGALTPTSWAIAASNSSPRELPGAPALRYVYAPTQARIMVVSVSVPATRAREVGFSLGHGRRTLLKEPSDNVQEVRAIATSGQRLWVTHPRFNAWVVHNAGQPFTLTYAVACDKLTFIGDTAIHEVYHPTLLPDRVFVWGWMAALMPDDEQLKHLPVYAEVRPGNFHQAVTSWHPSQPFVDADDLGQTMFIAGNYRLYRQSVDRAEVTIAVTGHQWKFSDAEFKTALSKVVRSEVKLMGTYPTTKMMVVLEEGNDSGSGGTAVTDGIAVYPPPSRRLDREADKLLALVAHEHFHLWNGKLIAARPNLPEGPQKWFSEGFTEYYAYKTLLREGLITPARWREVFNRKIEAYYGNPVAFSATERDYGPKYGVDQHYEDLSYLKGCLIAWLVDLQVQHQTRRAKSLDDLMRTMVAEARRGETYDNLTIERSLGQLTGTSWADFFDRYVNAAEALPVQSIAEAGGLRVVIDPQHLVPDPSFGSYDENAESHQVTHVEAGSAIERAGLRPMDRIVGYDISWDVLDRLSSITVMRDGERRMIQFRPSRTTAVPQLLGSTDNDERLAAMMGR